MKRQVLVWSRTVLILSLLLTLAPAIALAQGMTVSFSPSTTTAQVGDTVNVDLRIEGASDLYGAEVHIKFDPALLQVLDDDLVEPGVQILPGSLFPKSDPSYVAQNQVDNIAGTIDFAITLLAPESPLVGSGTLATIRFAAQMAGVSDLDWTSTLMANHDGQAIAHTSSDGQITVTASPTPPPPPVPDTRNCTDLIVNGDFEETKAWDMPVTPHKANYSTADKHGDARSVRLGIEPGDPDVYSHSSAYQKIHVPADATSVTLSFWARRFTQDTPKAPVDATVDLYDPAQVIAGTFDWSTKGTRAQYDWQEVLILQGGCYNWLATLMRERSNDGAWQQYVYDVSAFAGQDIVVYFNVINNGNGLRTWMYVDDVEVNACYDATPCAEMVRNTSFEWTSDWTLTTTPRTANYTTDAANTGSRSMRVGVVPPTGDVYSHSSAYQHVTIPAGALNPTLSFWYKAHSEDTVKSNWKDYDWSSYNPADVIAGRQPGGKCCGEVDWQEMLILGTDYRILSGGVVLRQVSNDGVWKHVTYDLSPYKGMTIVLYYNAINDGNGQRTWMYVDDVSVNLCGQMVYFDPPTRQVAVGDVFILDVRAQNIGDLYGFETTVRFDPAILEVVDADAGEPGIQVSLGRWWPGTTLIVVNDSDNSSGEIDLAASLQNPDPALNGGGVLMSIPFRAKAAGSTPLWFAALKLVDSTATVIPTSRQDGEVTVTTDEATLTGKVLLEGRSDHSGTLVQLDGGASVTTGADGSYSFITSAGSHTLDFSHAAYLSDSASAVGAAGSTVTVPQVTLLGGDVNDDGCIDILDIAAIGSQFGSSSPTPATADVNNDGVVDIVDVVLAAKNFGSCE